jgi:hypothetical protein
MKAKFFVVILVCMIVLLIVSTKGLFAANSDNPTSEKKLDKQKPVNATDIELVKKITLKGRSAGGGKGGKKVSVATGQLGADISGERYAVIVGISDYPGSGSDLNYSDDDAFDMYDALVDVNIYGFDTNNVTLLTDMDATRTAILDDINNIPVDADEIVFFFSGHGMKGIAEDWDKEKVDEAIVSHNGAGLVPIWDGELREAFAKFTTSRIVFIFDSCLSGGMKNDLGGSDRVIAMASTESGLAYEDPAWENGEFSYYFVDKGMLGGEANIHDYDVDDILKEPEQVTAEEAYDYSNANCKADRPTIDDSFEDDLLP